MYTFGPLSAHEQCIIRNGILHYFSKGFYSSGNDNVMIIRNGILHYFSKATQVVNDNVMKNVLSLTTRVASVVAK